MAITKKPRANPQPDEAKVQALINKGGSVAATEPEPEAEPEFSSVLLRLPVDMLQEIDASVKRRRPVRISRQAWIIEALHERLKAEKCNT
ncbi:MAG: hypothetical protein ACRERU_13850 [Methylococcales bacterium]